MDDLLEQFAPLIDEPPPVREVRGVAIAVAQHWWLTLPDCPAKQTALDLLAQAADVACSAHAA